MKATGRGGVFRCCETYRSQRREMIAKDRSKAGSKAIRHALAMQRIMSIMEASVAADLITGIAVFKKKISKDRLEKLLEAGKFDEAMDLIPWDQLPDDISKIEDKLQEAIVRGSEGSIAALPSPAVTSIVGTANPNVRRFIQEQVGSLVTDISNETRRSVQRTVFTAFDQGLTPRRAASRMVDAIGLTERQNAFVMNRQFKDLQKRDRLEAKLSNLTGRGLRSSKTAENIRRELRLLTDAQIEKRSERFAKNLQKQRSITVARTELTRAVNHGQIETWVAAANEGLIEGDKARKVWVVVPDDRLSNICADLDGKSVGLNEKFVVNQTGALVDGPPAHPNCRSSLSLKFEDE